MPRTARKDNNLNPGKLLKPANLPPRASAEWDRLFGELLLGEPRSVLHEAATRTLAAPGARQNRTPTEITDEESHFENQDAFLGKVTD